MSEPAPFRVDEICDGEEEDCGPLDRVASPEAVAEYLADMIGELESMARLVDLDLLVYLLSMARVEAQAQARPGPATRRDYSS